MKSACTLFCLLLLICASFCARGQQLSAGYDSIVYNHRETPSVKNARMLLRDSRGFIWAAGYDGLSRFDGRRFQNFSLRDGLKENDIKDLRESKDGSVFISSLTGVYRYTNGYPNAFTALHLPAAFKDIRSIYPRDSTSVYITDSSELWLLANKKWTKVEGVHAGLSSLQEDNNGILYGLTSANRIYIIKGNKVLDTVEAPPYLATAGQVQLKKRLEKDSRGNVFLNAMGLWRLSGTAPYIQPYHITPADPPHYNWAVEPAARGMLYQWGEAGWQPIMPVMLARDYHSELIPMPDGSFLMACYTIGLVHYYPRQYQNYVYDAMRNYYTYDRTGNRATHNDSLLYKNAAVREAKEKLISITGIFKSSDSTIWFCTPQGLYYLPGGKSPLQHYVQTSASTADDLQNSSFTRAMEYPAGRIFFQTNRTLVIYEKGIFRNAAGGPSNGFMAMGVDGAGIFYLSYYGMYALRDTSLYDISGQLGLGRTLITQMITDKEGKLWICPNMNVLYKIERDKNGQFRKTDSLAMEMKGEGYIPQTIIFDYAGNLWVASNSSTNIYLRQPGGRFEENKKIVIPKEEDATRFRLRFARDESRTLIYTNSSIFDAEKTIRAYNVPPPVVHITDLLLSRMKQDWQALKIKTDQYGIPVAPVFKSGQNFISFSFTGIVNTQSSDVLYQYRLTGLEEKWEPVTAEGLANYTNLSPGSYTFEVKAADLNGNWSAPVSYPFTISPPWYRTTLAWIAWVLLAALLVYGLLLLRIRYIRRQEKVKRMLTEHELKALRAQINPHFLQNSMEFLIQSIHNDSSGNIEKIVRQLSVYLRNVLHLSDKNVVRLEDELIFSEEYLAINKMLFHDSFTYNIVTDPEVDTFATKVPSMLLQPFLENAVKHGIMYVKEGKVITMSVTTANGKMYCTISNPVPEIKMQKKSDAHISKGIAITEERLGLLFPGQKKERFIKCTVADGVFTVVICIPGDF